MIGMGTAQKLIFSWGGNPGVGSLPPVSRCGGARVAAPLEIVEHSHAGMASAYEAGAAGLPCAFFRGYRGSDLPSVNPQIRFVTCPFSGEELACIPSIRPDAAIVHAQKADREGNVLIEGICRRTERSRAGRTPLGSDGGRDRGRLWPAELERSHSARLDAERGGGSAGRSAPVLCARLLFAGQCLLHRVDEIARERDRFSGLDATEHSGGQGAVMTYSPVR